MYTYLKCLFIVCALVALYLGCGFSSDDNYSRFDLLERQCNDAKHGTLDVNRGNYSDALMNSFLFGCAVSVVVPGPSMVSGESKSHKERLAKKMERAKIADFLLSKGIDPNYKNEYGDTLLMLTVSSFLPDAWKADTVRTLIKKGVSVDEKNSNGDTAMDLAAHRGTPGVIKVLSEYDKLD